ncbi:hypothetical protein [Aureliella helgolandensis]|uniref:Uncharacterized protein n=1 Tax=Aureliella helgolandensis TaxID=2527968 RepID=A0A518GEV3_9BACT|nr:hypothetical protein [Aureliella helgolandensis]QDV27123.1 hypothetical protein Q31a_55100 [Aureliella helgolandensis]
MQMLTRLFVAFCVGTVVAQAIVFAMAGARGNLKKETLVKGLALFNGIDISADQLEETLNRSRNTPNPTYEDVEQERAQQDRNLDMRQGSIKHQRDQVSAMLAELQAKSSAFDRRTKEFYELLDSKEKGLLAASLTEVKLTLEALGPEQAKDQILRMLEVDLLDDVVAIVKEMPMDKRKKIFGEFVNEADKEPEQLHKILMRLREGEPTKGVIQNARQNQPNT